MVFDVEALGAESRVFDLALPAHVPPLLALGLDDIEGHAHVLSGAEGTFLSLP